MALSETLVGTHFGNRAVGPCSPSFSSPSRLHPPFLFLCPFPPIVALSSINQHALFHLISPKIGSFSAHPIFLVPSQMGGIAEKWRGTPKNFLPALRRRHYVPLHFQIASGTPA